MPLVRKIEHISFFSTKPESNSELAIHLTNALVEDITSNIEELFNMKNKFYTKESYCHFGTEFKQHLAKQLISIFRDYRFTKFDLFMLYKQDEANHGSLAKRSASAEIAKLIANELPEQMDRQLLNSYVDAILSDFISNALVEKMNDIQQEVNINPQSAISLDRNRCFNQN